MENGVCTECTFDSRRVYDEELEQFVCESTCAVESFLWDFYVEMKDGSNNLVTYDQGCKQCGDGAFDEYCMNCDHLTGKC